MKKNLLSILFISSLAVVSCKSETNAEDAKDVTDVSELAQTLTVDAGSSVIEWVGSKPTGTHNGTIQLTSGSVSLEEGKLVGGKFEIDMNSIVVLDLQGDEKASLESHLKGTAEGKEDHFFDVVKFPAGSFEITSVTALEGNAVEISGNLTLKDITKNVTFAAKADVTEGSVKIYSETFSINRTDWGVNYGSKSIFEDLGDKFINDNIDLKINVVANN